MRTKALHDVAWAWGDAFGRPIRFSKRHQVAWDDSLRRLVTLCGVRIPSDADVNDGDGRDEGDCKTCLRIARKESAK